MATQIQTAVSYMNAVETTLSQMQRLINGLAPDPREWVYQGYCNDLGAPVGYCACGHPIRFEFVLKRERDGASAVVGSVCIDHYALISPSAAEWMRADLERMLEKIKADKREAERARVQLEVDAALKDYSVELDKLVALADAHRAAKPNVWNKLPLELWRAVEGYNRFPQQCTQEYKTPKLYLRWYKTNIGKVQGVIARNQLSPD